MRMSLSAGAGVILAVGIDAGAANAVDLPNLQSTMVHSGNGGATLTANTYNIIDKATIYCKDPDVVACQLLTMNMVSLSGNGANNGQWQICTFVDKVAVGVCSQQGRVPSGGANVVTGAGQATSRITKGEHEIETEVYVTTNTTLQSWQVNYFRYGLYL